MASFRVTFRDGPCAGQSRLVEMGVRPNETIQCGGKTYELFPSANPAVLVYVVSGGLIDQAASTIHGQRDAMRAWHRLLSTLDRTARGNHRRLAAASRRMRRAVR